MSRYYKATIVPTVSGGNIEVRVPANSATQALGIIKTLPYFKSFVRQPVTEEEKKSNLTTISDLLKKANAQHQAELAEF